MEHQSSCNTICISNDRRAKLRGAIIIEAKKRFNTIRREERRRLRRLPRLSNDCCCDIVMEEDEEDSSEHRVEDGDDIKNEVQILAPISPTPDSLVEAVLDYLILPESPSPLSILSSQSEATNSKTSLPSSSPSRIIIDLGCGDGRWIVHALRKIISNNSLLSSISSIQPIPTTTIVGVDIDTSRLALAREAVQRFQCSSSSSFFTFISSNPDKKPSPSISKPISSPSATIKTKVEILERDIINFVNYDNKILNPNLILIFYLFREAVDAIGRILKERLGDSISRWSSTCEDGAVIVSVGFEIPGYIRAMKIVGMNTTKKKAMGCDSGVMLNAYVYRIREQPWVKMDAIG